MSVETKAVDVVLNTMYAKNLALGKAVGGGLDLLSKQANRH